MAYFFLKLFHFLRLRSFKFSPSVHFSGPYYWFLCRSFWICLPVYPPCHWAHSHQIVRALFWPCYPSLWSLTSAAICLQSGPAYLPSIISPCPQHDIPGSLDCSSFSDCLLLFYLSWSWLMWCPAARVYFLPVWSPFQNHSLPSLPSSGAMCFLITVAGSDPFFLYASLSIAW